MRKMGGGVGGGVFAASVPDTKVEASTLHRQIDFFPLSAKCKK